MLQGLVILYGISFVLGILVIVRVWRASALDGVLSLFIPGYVLYALYKYWGDPDHDIRWLLLAQFAAAGLLVWNVLRVAPSVLDEHALVAAQESGAADDDDQANGGYAAANRPASLVSTSAPDTTVPALAATRTLPTPGPATEAEPPRRATPAELQRLAEKLAFLRGSFVREAIGLRFDVPAGQHLLTGADARHADTALRGEHDAHLIGWMIAANKTLTDPNLRIVRLRWRHDGLVGADDAALDPAALLDAAARAQARVPRLAGSGGALLRYDAVPVREGSTILWSEERRPEDAKASVYDCHALRLARKGVLEISIVGTDAKAAKSCVNELRALAATVRFDADADYPAQIGGERLAAYSLSGLITQTQ